MVRLITMICEEQEDRTPYPIKAVIAFREAKKAATDAWRLRNWCDMAAVPVSAKPLARPYRHLRPYPEDPLPDDPLLKLAVLVVQMRAEQRIRDVEHDYWCDAVKSAEEAEKKGFIEIPLVSETFEAWKARKATEPVREAIL